LLPGLPDGVDQLPRGIELVASHEQREIALDHIGQQALVGIELPGLECVGEVEA